MTRYIFIVCISITIFVQAFTGKGNECYPEEDQKIATSNNFDTIYTLDYVKYLAGKKNSLGGFILDSIERKSLKENYKNVPHHKILLMRAYTASRNLKPNLAISYLLKAFKMEDVQKDPEDYMFVTGLLSNEYFVLNRIDESMKYQLLCVEKAKSTGNLKKYALGKLNLWMAHFEKSKMASALEEVKNARMILRNNGSDSVLIIWSMEVEAGMYMSTGEYEKAIGLYRQILSIYDNLKPKEREGTELASDVNLRFKKGQACITLAMLYAYVNDKKSGEKYYSEWKRYHSQCPEVLSLQLYSIVMGYLKLSGKYDEALRYSLGYEKIASKEDSINNFVLIVKKHVSSIYNHLGDYKRAYEYGMEAMRINDSLSVRSNFNAAAEMAEIYETGEKQTRILEQEVIISRGRIYIYSLIVFLSAVVIISLIIWFNSRKIAGKNRSLFDKIEKLSSAKFELDKIRLALSEQCKEPVSPDNDLCKTLDVFMNDRKFYLDPNLTREAVATELCTNKLYLSNAIKEVHSKTFGEYVNGLRLEYAKNILMNDFDIKIEAVSLMSGFRSVRTFYRLFQNAYNLTPTEFRRLASDRKNTSDY